MRVREIALEGSRFNRVDRQNRKQHRAPTQRIVVEAHHAAARLLNQPRNFRCGSFGFFQPALRWSEPLGAGFGLARTPTRRCTLCHNWVSILSPPIVIRVHSRDSKLNCSCLLRVSASRWWTLPHFSLQEKFLPPF